MTLPAVTVTGTVLDASQQPLSGTVTFTPAAGDADTLGAPVITSVTDEADQVIIPMTGITEKLDTTGHFSVTLTPTDTAGLAPAGWLYQVAIEIPGVPDYGFTCAIPSTPNPVDLSALVPVAPPVPPLPGDGGTAQWDLAIAAGSLVRQVVGLTNPDGSPWDITGATWEYVIRTTADAAGSAAASVTTTATDDGQLTVTDNGDESQVALTLNPAATVNLAPGEYAHALWENPGTADALAVAAGVLTINATAQP